MRARLRVTLGAMETFVILAAVTACAAAGVVVAALARRGRRGALRMDSDLDAEDEALLLAEIGPPESPIDRSAAVLDLDPIRRPAQADAPRRIAGHGPTGDAAR
ncbi:hypothetical protein [uncultured Methylobacterium sp.]|uniref:hypothetical protein n=1 Tax=uncultured Methylobacterium sp. TaxID=157278 RepID=UPI0035CC8665